MLTATSEIDLYPPLSLKILGVELYFVILLIATDCNQQGVSHIIIVQMEGYFVVPILIRRDSLANRDSRVFDQDLDVRNRLSILPAKKSLDGEPMIGFVRGKKKRRRREGPSDERNDTHPPSRLPSSRCSSLLPHSPIVHSVFPLSSALLLSRQRKASSTLGVPDFEADSSNTGIPLCQ